MIGSIFELTLTLRQSAFGPQEARIKGNVPMKNQARPMAFVFILYVVFYEEGGFALQWGFLALVCKSKINNQSINPPINPSINESFNGRQPPERPTRYISSELVDSNNFLFCEITEVSNVAMLLGRFEIFFYSAQQGLVPSFPSGRCVARMAPPSLD